MAMRLGTVSLVAALVLAGGCQSEVRPTGAASRDGTIVAPVQVGVQGKADVSSRAYANFAAAVLLHARSDRLIIEAGGLERRTAWPSRHKRRRLHQEALHLWKQAVQRYQGVLRHDPKSIEGSEGLARGYFDRGSPQLGIHWLKRAVAIDGEDFKLLYRLGVRCEQAKRTPEAVQAYARAEKARPGPEKSRLLPLTLLKLGRLYENQKQLDKAAATYIRFIELKKETDDVYGDNSALIGLLKNRAPVHRKLAEVYSRQGKHAKAAEAFRTAYRLQPRVTRSLLRLAAAYSAAGDYQRAIQTCKKYVEKEPNRLDGMTLLVDIYKKMVSDHLGLVVQTVNHNMILAKKIDKALSAHDEPAPKGEPPAPASIVPEYQAFSMYNSQMRTAGWTLVKSRAFSCSDCGQKAKLGKWTKDGEPMHEACTNAVCSRYLPPR